MANQSCEQISNKEYPNILPTKVLKNYIFKRLSGHDLYKCRAVCKPWKQIIDDVAKKDDRWRKYCKKEFKKVYKLAHKNSPLLSWFNIYKSLFLWSKIDQANMSSRLFTEIEKDAIISFFQIFDNKIGLFVNDSIEYYDLQTSKKLENRNYNEIFSKYRENDKIVAVINFYASRLLVCPKVGAFDTFTSFQEAFLEVEQHVTDFVLVDLNIYYIMEDGNLYICKVTEDLKDAEKIFLKQFDGKVLSLSFTNNLHILTENYEIYSFIDNNFSLKYVYITGPGLFHNLNEYNFLENMKWSDVYRWIANKNLDSGPVDGIKWIISAIKPYGDIFLVGTVTGILSVYNTPFVNGQLDFTTRPLKEYDIGEIIKLEEKDQPANITDDRLSEDVAKQVTCIDVVEIENGHVIYLATKGYIIVLKFTHNSKRKASDVIMSNNLKIKIFKK